MRRRAEKNPTPTWVVYGSLIFVQVLFGVHYLAAKVVLHEIPPGLWALLRVAGAGGLLLIVALALRRPLPRSWPVIGRLALFSVFGVVINQLCFVEGLSRTTPTHSSIIMTSIPVGTLLFALLLRREQAQARKLISLGVGFIGVMLVIRPTASELAQVTVLGDLLTLTNALSYSFFLVISKRVLSRIDSLSATTLLLLFGTLGMSVPGFHAAAGFRLADVSLLTWALGLFIVLFPTALAYLLTYWALARVESSVVAFFIYLQPLIATSLSVALFGDRLTPALLAGAALIFLAVYLTLSRPR
jgi:drug/metabolite transporter (DMT)-like permease